MIPYIKIIKKKTFSELLNQVKAAGQLRKIELDFIKSYRDSNFGKLPPENPAISSEIINGIKEVHQFVVQLVANNENSRWFDTSMTKFNELLSHRDRVSDKNLYNNLISDLVRHLNANQGALYLIEDIAIEDYKIIEVAKYAYNRQKKSSVVLSKGEGLVGQCILDKDYVFMTDIPQYYTKITSGLGEATPTSILITPIMLDDKPIGVIELASFSVFAEREIKFLKALGRVIASAVNNIQQAQQLINLYQTSQVAQKEVREQEEEIRQQMEELIATNEDINRKTLELEDSKRKLEESNLEMQKMKEMEKYIIESKLEAQRTSYELIINRLKNRLQLQN